MTDEQSVWNFLRHTFKEEYVSDEEIDQMVEETDLERSGFR